MDRLWITSPPPPTDKNNSESDIPPLIPHERDHWNRASSDSDSDSVPEDNNWYNPKRTTTQKRPHKRIHSQSTLYRHASHDTDDSQLTQTQGNQPQRPPAEREDTSPQTQPSHPSPTNITLRTAIQPIPINDPTLYSVFNPGHSHVMAKEKRNICQNETNNDFLKRL